MREGKNDFWEGYMESASSSAVAAEANIASQCAAAPLSGGMDVDETMHTPRSVIILPPPKGFMDHDHENWYG
jgi:hypothetical protein